MYSDFNGENFLECVMQVAEQIGNDSVLDVLAQFINNNMTDEEKLSVLNCLWCM